jgi:hypothetical protein
MVGLVEDMVGDGLVFTSSRLVFVVMSVYDNALLIYCKPRNYLCKT